MDVMTEGISHTPFIIASYAVAAVLLAWCALAPRFRRNAALKSIRKLIKLEGSTRDTDS
jgi:heme exporter protein CcmD